MKGETVSKLSINLNHFWRFLHRYRIIDFVLLFAISIIVYRGWFSSGIITWGDWWPQNQERMLEMFSRPFIYHHVSNGGFSELMSLPHFFPIFMHGALAKLGLSYSMIERILYYFLFLFLSLISMYYLTHILFKKRLASFFASFFYVQTTFILIIASGGLLTWGVAYAFAPLILALFIESMDRDKERLKKGILCGICIAISASYGEHITYLTVGIIFAYFICNIFLKIWTREQEVLKYIRESIGLLTIIAVVPFILHFYWILPLFMSRAGIPLPASYMRPGAIISEMSLLQGVSLYQFQWSENYFRTTGTMPQNLIIPILVFLAILLNPRNRYVIFFSLLGLASAFMVKGTHPPFGGIYAWFFSHFPGGVIFRGACKFFSLVSLAYALLLGVSVQSIFERIKRPAIARFGFLVGILLILLSLIWPQIKGPDDWTWVTRTMPEEHIKIESFLKSKPGPFRVYWQPFESRFSWYDTKRQLTDFNLFSAPFSNYFLHPWFQPGCYTQTSYLGKILGIGNVKYVTIPYEEFVYQVFQKSEEELLDSLDRQKGLKKISLGEGVFIYQNEYFLPRFFTTSQGSLIVGGLSSLLSLSLQEDLNFSRCALFLAEQLKGETLNNLERVSSVVFYRKRADDLILASVTNDYRYDLSLYLPKERKDRPSWHLSNTPGEDFAYRYGEIVQSRSGTIETEARATITIPIQIEEGGLYDIWLHSAVGPGQGEIRFFLDQASLGNVSLQNNWNELRWMKIAAPLLEKGKHTINVENIKGRSLLDQLVIIPHQALGDIRKRIEEELNSKKTMHIYEFEDFAKKGWSISQRYGGEAGMTEVISNNYSPFSLSIPISLPAGGEYRVAIHASCEHFIGELYLGERLIPLGRKRKGLTWVESEPLILKEGENIITFKGEGEGRIYLDQLILYRGASSLSNFFKEGSTTPVSWEMINPTKYRIKFSQKRPSFLIWSENYDPTWRLKHNHSSLIPTLAYSAINSFYIDKKGKIEATIEYPPQRFVDKGSIVSGIGVGLVISYLIYLPVAFLKKKASHRRRD